jgi:hypothetical protein
MSEEYEALAVPEAELREQRRRCWGVGCANTAVLRDWTGWRYCLRCYLRAVLRPEEKGQRWRYVRWTRWDWRG